jgi:hypothetical protein
MSPADPARNPCYRWFRGSTQADQQPADRFPVKSSSVHFLFLPSQKGIVQQGREKDGVIMVLRCWGGGCASDGQAVLPGNLCRLVPSCTPRAGPLGDRDGQRAPPPGATRLDAPLHSLVRRLRGLECPSLSRGWRATMTCHACDGHRCVI